MVAKALRSLEIPLIIAPDLDILSVVLLSACGTTGTINSDLLGQPIPANKAQLIVSRNDAFKYGGVGAKVSLNGTPIANLARGATVVQNISPGNNVLSVTSLGDPGNYTATLDAKKGNTYHFEVAPNEGKSLWVTAAFGYVGDAISASNNSNTGYFQITPKAGQ